MVSQAGGGGSNGTEVYMSSVLMPGSRKPVEMTAE